MIYEISKSERGYMLILQNEKDLRKSTSIAVFFEYKELIKYLDGRVIAEKDTISQVGLSQLETAALECFKDKIKQK